MSEEINARPSRRYVALDIHKYYCVVAGVNRDGQVVLQPVRGIEADQRQLGDWTSELHDVGGIGVGQTGPCRVAEGKGIVQRLPDVRLG